MEIVQFGFRQVLIQVQYINDYKYIIHIHIYNIYTWFLACVGLLLLQFLIELKLGSAASDWEMYGILEVHPF